jgi:hypothetical protein
MSATEAYLQKGWLRFAAEESIRDWAAHAQRCAETATADPAHAKWLDCEGTWFIGVDALPNDPDGRLPSGPPLEGAALDFIRAHFGEIPALHRGQLSVIYPGYPRPRRGESDAAFGYRCKRDGAHVDGIKIYGTARRRRVEEPHAWVLGLPLNKTSKDAAPLVVWEGSHLIMREAFRQAFEGIALEDWAHVDITDIYTAARREVFETCKRVEVHANPGEAYLMHRLCLHGVAPWADGASATDGAGRMIAYFRPEMPNWQAHWLSDL